MKILAILLVFFTLSTTMGCIKRTAQEQTVSVVNEVESAEEDNEPVIIYDTIYMDQEEWDCVEKKMMKEGNIPVILVDTVYVTEEEWNKLQNSNHTRSTRIKSEAIAKNQLENLSKESPVISQNINTVGSSSENVVDKDYSELKQYSVTVASLASEEGAKRLKKIFKETGVNCFVVKNPQGKLYHFILFSSDSKDEVIAERKKFLSDHVAGKSDSEIWKKYFIRLQDAFVMNKDRK